MADCYGLDYGSTTSMLYKYEDGKPMEISNMRSAVRVTTSGDITACGDKALDGGEGKVVESPKRRFIDNHDNATNCVGCEEMIAYTMTAMMKSQQKNLPGCHLTLTVPNGYTAEDYIAMHGIVKQALRNTIHEACDGVNVHMLPEPVAAALHYVHCCMGRDNFTNKHFIVCDIGGGTTDLSIVTCSKEGRKLSFKVEKGQQSDKNLGGNDFTERLATILGQNYDRCSIEMRGAIEIIKIDLSSLENSSQIMNLQCDRKTFESCIGNELDRLGRLMESLKEKSDIIIDNQSVVLRVGGSCRIPAIRELLKAKFKDAHQTVDAETGDCFYSVAMGASIYSAYCAGLLSNEYDSISIENATPHEFSYRKANYSWTAIVPQNSKDGTYQSEVLRLDGAVTFEDGTYSPGNIMLKEEGAEPMEWPMDKRKRFALKGRNVEDIRVQLTIEIKNSLLHSCQITDLYTRENNIWEIGTI